MCAVRDTELPATFSELCKTSDLAALQDVFVKCDVNAVGGFNKQTALAFSECPNELVSWLIENGASLEARDSLGNTPLHTRARAHRTDILVLLECGADVHARNNAGATPLHTAAESMNTEHATQLIAFGAEVNREYGAGLTPLAVALRACTNAHLERMPAFVTKMLEAGAVITPEMRGLVESIGARFERYRDAFNPARVEAAQASLEFLYSTFDVPPVPRIKKHDGISPIIVSATSWAQQHAELWELLVPGKGPAHTVQGEVIRISGRISDEWERNGGINWDADYAEMAAGLVQLVRTGNPLPSTAIAELDAIIAALDEQEGDGNARVAELAVHWVLLNPMPVPLAQPSYQR
jgi:hypothetical protein